MTTTEKRGFRLPWGGETRKTDDELESGPGAAASAVLTPATDLAPAIAPSSGAAAGSGSILRRGQVEDLGRGPFDLAPDEDPAGSAAAASLVDVVEPAPKSAPEPESEQEPMHEAVAAPAAESTPKDGAAAWPEVDRRGSATHLASDAPPPLRPAVVVEGSKKVNPLVAGLVKAMRDAARAARAETTARMRADAAARAEQIRLEAVAAGSTLKKQADEDVAGIREWSRAEAARIKQETDARIADRKARLLRDVEAHAAATERLNGELKATIEAFEAEMERFFDLLLKEDDPARLATLAERLPEPPTFARLGDMPAPAKAPRARSTTPRKPAEHKDRPAPRLAPDAAAAAEAEAILGLDEETARDDAAPFAETIDVPAMATAATDPTDEIATETPLEATADAFEPTADGSEPMAAAPLADPWASAAWSDATEPVAAPADDPVEHDHDTNGHVAPVADAPEDADSMAAWSDALAAIRAQATALDEAPAEDAPDASPAEPDLGAFDAPPDSLLGVLAGANRINSPDDLSPEERIALLGFDEPAPGEEPAPMTVTPVEAPPTESITRVVVAGLASVAEISAFKSALVAVPGVNSVSVSTGTDDDFVFSVVHATKTDLRVAVPGFARFGPKLTADDGAVLTFTLAEPGT